MTANPFEPPRVEVADVVRGEVGPPLWNPNAAASWSLLFSPAFGAFLHMKNWQALGEPEKAATAKTWFISVISALVLFSFASMLLPNDKMVDALSRVLSFALLLGWYFSSGKAQVAYITARYGLAYPRRSWGQPLLWAVGALVAFFVFAVVCAMVIGSLQNDL